jgi:putative transposase
MQITRVLTINLTRKLTNEQLTIINHLTYSASKLWNTSNYEVIQRNIKPNKIDVQMILVEKTMRNYTRYLLVG